MPNLTVFVISAGKNPNLPTTLAALKRQDVPFTLKRIIDVAPMSRAFQRMLDDCETPYFVQIDEDMVLYDNHLRTMFETIKQAKDKVGMVAFQLQDPHLDMLIYGVKIYRHGIVSRYPYNLEHSSCEVEQLDRMKADGFDYLTSPAIMGEHSPIWNTATIFDRYWNLMMKFKAYRYPWLESLPAKLWAKLQADPSELNLYALMGAFIGIISDNAEQAREKDYTQRHREEAVLSSWLRGPKDGTLYLTSKCNFHCAHCKRESAKGVPTTPDIAPEMVGDFLRRFPTIGAVCLCGFGEPLMHENLLPIMQHLKHDLGLVTGLVTNGSLIKERLFPGLIQYEAPPDYVSVSLNTHDPAEHYRITGTNTWSDTLCGIKMLVDKGIPTYLSRICTTANLHYVPKFLELANELGVNEVHLHNLLPYCEELDKQPFDDLVLQRDRDVVAIETLKNHVLAGIVGVWPTLIDPDQSPQWCEHPYYFVGIDGLGNLSLCNSVDGPTEACTLTDQVWQSKYAQGLRQRVQECSGPCKKCFRNWMMP